MSTSGHQKFGGSWTIGAWLLWILSGALVTSLIRAPHVLSTITPSLVMSHLVLGAVIVLMAIGQVMSATGVTRWWRLMLVAATAMSGWLAHRSVSPHTAAMHAALAALATIALADFRRGARADRADAVGWWTTVVSRAGFSLIIVQLAAGAALRHHLIDLPWHLFVGGLATMAVLGCAVPTTQHQQATAAEKRAAGAVIAAILGQVSLGIAVWFMILMGPPHALSWITTTSAHVVGGSLTLLAVGRFTWLLREAAVSTGGGGAS